jgi:hypothetical protein
MSEPAFIKSSEPFKVAMPEGSTVARSQTAKVGNDVRRVLADDEFVNAEVHVDENSVLLQSGRGRKSVAFASTNTLSPATASAPLAKTNPAAAQAAALAADAKEEERLAMAEMNFPARIVHLKIENDAIREQLNALDTQIKPRRK